VAHACIDTNKQAKAGMRLQVRAANLQELVYKQGQAGITKATVSVTWCNDDPDNGPAGYEDKERITVTRTVCHMGCMFLALHCRGEVRKPAAHSVEGLLMKSERMRHSIQAQMRG
jgi:hypothetical protein